jgi:hypothetical protein
VYRPRHSQQSKAKAKADSIVARAQQRNALSLWLRESRLRIRNGNNPKLSNNKENPSKNEQTRSSTDHMLFLIKDRFMLGEEDGLLDDFLGDVHSVHHIAAVPRRQIRHACA